MQHISSKLSALSVDLRKPFPLHQITIRPVVFMSVATMASLSIRINEQAIYQRLDEVVGRRNWRQRISVQDTILSYSLTIRGVTHQQVFQLDVSKPELFDIIKLRAIYEVSASFGIGRYIANLPGLWADYDLETEQFKDIRQVIRMFCQLSEILVADEARQAQGQQKSSLCMWLPAERHQSNFTSFAPSWLRPPLPDQPFDPASASQCIQLAQTIYEACYKYYGIDTHAVHLVNLIGDAFGIARLANATTEIDIQRLELNRYDALALQNHLQPIRNPWSFSQNKARS